MALATTSITGETATVLVAGVSVALAAVPDNARTLTLRAPSTNVGRAWVKIAPAGSDLRSDAAAVLLEPGDAFTLDVTEARPVFAAGGQGAISVDADNAGDVVRATYVNVLWAS